MTWYNNASKDHSFYATKAPFGNNTKFKIKNHKTPKKLVMPQFDVQRYLIII